ITTARMERRGGAAPASFVNGIARAPDTRSKTGWQIRAAVAPQSTVTIFILRGARTVARISQVAQIGSQFPTNGLAALIFTHASGMVNAIARGSGSREHSRLARAGAR